MYFLINLTYVMRWLVLNYNQKSYKIYDLPNMFWNSQPLKSESTQSISTSEPTNRQIKIWVKVATQVNFLKIYQKMISLKLDCDVGIWWVYCNTVTSCILTLLNTAEGFILHAVKPHVLLYWDILASCFKQFNYQLVTLHVPSVKILHN